MSKRLQVVLPDEDMAALQQFAQRDRISVGELVRRELKAAQERRPKRSVEEKLRAIRELAQGSAPTGDIDQMNTEIMSGYIRGWSA
ncbi:MAG: antitoxin [Acidobacteria bacterium]|nr:antitoxin [Acidobacteriota bacterium]